MEWLRARLGLVDSPCTTCACSSPCTVHQPIPDWLKIDYESPLSNTVKPYVRHVLWCSTTVSTRWPPKPEEVLASIPVTRTHTKQHAQIQGSIEQRLAAVASKAGDHLGGRVVVTALDVSATPSPLAALHSVHGAPGDMELIVLPEGTALHVPANLDAAAVLESYLTSPDADMPHGVQRHAIFQENTTADATTLVLVCAHKLRDKRCGVVGPMLVDTFRYVFEWHCTQRTVVSSCCIMRVTATHPRHRTALQEHPIEGRRVLVYGVSHTGGHKFAGTRYSL